MTSLKGNIFNIQKFSITDGVGIRTLIFMKGCPLRCLWCSNPESQKPYHEIMDVKVNCINCGKCVTACSVSAIEETHYNIDRNVCTRCGDCTKVCYANAKKMTGREYSIQEILEIVDKDRVFYRVSGGGVTVGGGEPTMQSEFVSELLKNCQLTNIHTSIETCGHGKWEKIEPVFRYTDQIFYDLKTMNSSIHQNVTGVGNETILENARKLAEMGKQIIFRVPVIPGINNDDENLGRTGAFVKELSAINPNVSIELLPYHTFGMDKYRWLNRTYPMTNVKALTDEDLYRCKSLVAEQGVTVV